jgi:cell division transport system permease protein
MKAWLLRHAQVLVGSFGQLARTPIATALTLTVIGITLALPAGLVVAINNLDRLSAGFDRGGQISLFLKQDTSDAAAQKLAQQLRARSGVATVEYISREAALAEFRKHSGFGSALDALSGNPLPAVLVVRPEAGTSPAALETLRTALARQPGVELAELDLAWVKRLHALLELAERAVWLLAVLLAAAVLLIVGNTIRLAVLNRQTEIEVIQLVGGTPAFIRRPFLYAGWLQGLLGGLIAWLLVELGLLWLTGPVSDLAGLYGSPFGLEGLPFASGLALVASGGILGWLGSRLAVGWHLRRQSFR